MINSQTDYRYGLTITCDQNDCCKDENQPPKQTELTSWLSMIINLASTNREK